MPHSLDALAMTMTVPITRGFTEHPLAFFLTWTTYGSWLPGDARGWTDERGHHRDGDELRRRIAERACRGRPVLLTSAERVLVARVIGQHCLIRSWGLHAVAVRAQHVHVVVTALGVSPRRVRQELKGWTSRRLSEHCCGTGLRRAGTWWTECGSTRWIRTPESLDAVVTYVVECQDKPRA
jgi:REP element-mobilizing transposase RayT